eukprot:2392406-Amphidinium_carterae.1
MMCSVSDGQLRFMACASGRILRMEAAAMLEAMREMVQKQEARQVAVGTHQTIGCPTPQISTDLGKCVVPIITSHDRALGDFSPSNVQPFAQCVHGGQALLGSLDKLLPPP